MQPFEEEVKGPGAAGPLRCLVGDVPETLGVNIVLDECNKG